MTSLEAQNHFGEMIDTSQREPVLITRRGRPVSVVFSPSGNPTDSLVQFMRLARLLSPLKGAAATTAYAAYAKKAGNKASDAGLTEEEVTALVHANR